MTPRKPTVGDALGNAGSPVFLAVDGRQHPVAYPDLGVLDRVEKLVVRRAFAAVESLADTFTPAQQARAEADLNAMIRAGEHGTGGQLWSREFGADGGARGLAMILWACLQQGRESLDPVARAKLPEVAFDDVPALLNTAEGAAVAALVLPDFCRAVAQRRRLPTAPLLAKLNALLAPLLPKEPETEGPAPEA